MTQKTAELRNIVGSDPRAKEIAYLWTKWDNQRLVKKAQWKELRSYLFATDTSTTTNATLPWKNSTTLPKLTQIRDNLHANYLATLLPNDHWLKWEGHDDISADVKTSEIVENYIMNKIRDSKARTTISQLLYDYIDYGNAFTDVEYVKEYYTDPDTGEVVPGYIGPRIIRISPYDIVFNPLSDNFKDSPNITRRILSFGDVEKEIRQIPDSELNEEGFTEIKKIRTNLAGMGFTEQDFDKAFGYSVDGFGSLKEYYDSNMVELLTFEGDFYDPIEQKLYESEQITIADRTHIIRRRKIPNWFGKTSKEHVSWRLRPDNLWGMGPMDNLVGMQYRIDHLENLKADVFDLIAHPPLVIEGEVEDFTWGPGEEIHAIDGKVTMLNPDTTALNADTQIQLLEQKMEEFAGAPRQAMGIRTPGEKTAFEVQTLHNAASRIFQEKIRSFEVGLLEPTLNNMLETARRNIDVSDVVRVIDNDLGATKFLQIDKEDITAKGKLRPVGARHFAEEAQLVQTLTMLANSNLIKLIQNHVSGKRLAFLLEDMLNLDRFDLVQENVAVLEQAETQRVINQAQEDIKTEQATPAESPPQPGS